MGPPPRTAISSSRAGIRIVGAQTVARELTRLTDLARTLEARIGLYRATGQSDDAAAVSDERRIEIETSEGAEVLLFDLAY